MINFNNKTLMITGGTGSFGNAVLNRFAYGFKGNPHLSRDERSRTICVTNIRRNIPHLLIR